MILPSSEGGFSGAITIDRNICIVDTSLRKYMPKYIKPISNRNNITCGCKTCMIAMLFQSYLNKYMIPQWAKFDKLYINSASIRLLEISNNDSIEYKKQIFLNDSHIHLRACDTASSYHCSSQINGSKIPKRDCILNCCSDFPMMNAPFLESSEQLNCFFPASLRKIKFHIFQNISKFLIHILIPFKHNNMCELCDIVPERDKRGRIMVKKCFVLHEEVIDVFHEIFIFPQ